MQRQRRQFLLQALHGGLAFTPLACGQSDPGPPGLQPSASTSASSGGVTSAETTSMAASSTTSEAASSATSEAASSAPAQPPKRLGVAILGLGSYASRLLAPGLQLTEHCYFAGMVTGTPSKIPEWQQAYSIKDSNIYTYDTMADLANNPEIDVVYVVTPTSTHAEFAIKAANAGKHVCAKSRWA